MIRFTRYWIGTNVEHLLLRLADLVQTAATAWAALVGDVDDHINARQMRRQTAAIAIGARPYRRPERGALLFSFVLAGAPGFILVRRANGGLFNL